RLECALGPVGTGEEEVELVAGLEAGPPLVVAGVRADAVDPDAGLLLEHGEDLVEPGLVPGVGDHLAVVLPEVDVEAGIPGRRLGDRGGERAGARGSGGAVDECSAGDGAGHGASAVEARPVFGSG